MKGNSASKILKVILIIFSLGVIFMGSYVLPLMAKQQTLYYLELSYAKWPILITCEVLLIMLLIGFNVIMNLVTKFDRGETLSADFIKCLEVLATLCLIASIVLIIIFSFLRYHGGPGPLLFLLMTGTIFGIWLVTGVIILIRAIIKRSIEYKTDNELTV